MIRRLSHSVKIGGSGSDPSITFSFGKCLQLPWSYHLVLVLHQKHIRRQHRDNKHFSTGHNIKITDHLLCNLQKTQSNFNFITLSAFACHWFVILFFPPQISYTTFFWWQFLTTSSMASPHLPLSPLYTHINAHRYPTLIWSWAPLIRMTLIILFPVPSYHIRQFNVISFSFRNVQPWTTTAPSLLSNKGEWLLYFSFVLQCSFRNVWHL